MDKRDSDKMIKLAREGKAISKIMEEDFSNYSYWDVYWEVYGAGEKSAVGAKRMISNRLKKLPQSAGEDQQQMIDEINELVWHLYSRYRESQQKLDEIRAVVEG